MAANGDSKLGNYGWDLTTVSILFSLLSPGKCVSKGLQLWRNQFLMQKPIQIQKSIERTRYIIWVIWARWVDPPAPRMLGLQALGFFLPVVLNIVRMCVMGGR